MPKTKTDVLISFRLSTSASILTCCISAPLLARCNAQQCLTCVEDTVPSSLVSNELASVRVQYLTWIEQWTMGLADSVHLASRRAATARLKLLRLLPSAPPASRRHHLRLTSLVKCVVFSSDCSCADLPWLHSCRTELDNL